MTEFTPTSPTPTAVPWTPDMAVPPAPTTAPSPAPIPTPQPVAHPAHQPMPSVVQQPQYQAQAQHPMPQTPQMNPPVQPQTQAHLPKPAANTRAIWSSASTTLRPTTLTTAHAAAPNGRSTCSRTAPQTRHGTRHAAADRPAFKTTGANDWRRSAFSKRRNRQA